MWNKTITIYNRYEDNLTGLVQWFRHTLNNCFVKRTNNKITVGNVQLQSDNTIVRVPEQANYKSPYLWEELTKEEKAKHITFKGGDLVFFGEITEDIDELNPSKNSNAILQKYNLIGSIVINSVNVNDFCPGSHYLIKGE